MRKAINENPVAQIAVLGVLAVVVAFLLMTRVLHKDAGSSATPGSTAAAPAAPADASAPPATAPAAPATADTAMPVGAFEAGPGLPAAVVKAYEANETVVLLIVRHNGIEDASMQKAVDRLRSRSALAVFVTRAKHISRYARITEGVDVQRVPALGVLQPRHLTKGDIPRASVSYGFRGPDSVDQAIRDALYKGPADLPSYPK